MSEEYAELRSKILREISNGNAMTVHYREQQAPDIDGVRRIIQDYEVGAILIEPQLRNYPDTKLVNRERFYKLNDPDLQRLGRQALIKEWFYGVFPPPEIGDVFLLKSQDHKCEGEAMACLVEGGRYSFIWTRKIHGNFRVGEYALQGCASSLEELIKKWGHLFCTIVRTVK